MMRSTDAETVHERLAREAVAALPPEREDEPASLRRDIFDELVDHLSCALRRELLRTNGDAARAERNVREAFGDPGRVARRLWFDAMKGKLMAQKILIGTSGLLAAGIAALAFFGWRLVESNRETAAALLAQSEKSQAALLERLTAIEQQPGWSGTPEWNPFVLKFVTDAAGSPPAADVKVQVTGPTGTGGEWQFPYEERRTGEDGVIDLSPAKVGQYFVTASTAWGEQSGTQATMMPGRPLEKTIVVPAGPPPMASAAFEVAWPEALKGREPWAILTFSQRSSRVAGKQQWDFMTPQVIAFHADGRVIDLLERYRSDSNAAFDQFGVWRQLARSREIKTGFEKTYSGNVSLWWVTLWPEAELPRDPESLFSGGVTALYSSQVGGSFSRPGDFVPLGLGGFGGGIEALPAGNAIDALPPTFSITQEGANRWSVTIPDALIEEYRKRLAERGATTAMPKET